MTDFHNFVNGNLDYLFFVDDLGNNDFLVLLSINSDISRHFLDLLDLDNLVHVLLLNPLLGDTLLDELLNGCLNNLVHHHYLINDLFLLDQLLDDLLHRHLLHCLQGDLFLHWTGHMFLKGNDLRDDLLHENLNIPFHWLVDVLHLDLGQVVHLFDGNLGNHLHHAVHIFLGLNLLQNLDHSVDYLLLHNRHFLQHGLRLSHVFRPRLTRLKFLANNGNRDVRNNILSLILNDHPLYYNVNHCHIQYLHSLRNLLGFVGNHFHNLNLFNVDIDFHLFRHFLFQNHNFVHDFFILCHVVDTLFHHRYFSGDLIWNFDCLDKVDRDLFKLGCCDRHLLDLLNLSQNLHVLGHLHFKVINNFLSELDLLLPSFHILLHANFNVPGLKSSRLLSHYQLFFQQADLFLQKFDFILAGRCSFLQERKILNGLLLLLQCSLLGNQHLHQLIDLRLQLVL
mmetsp:Transcript_71124/g.189846  ORF Transcript_71124/g.189846 Transcript_71124/m.189846 type:complete len:452 (-) Transcript_71124:407-1762(-)